MLKKVIFSVLLLSLILPMTVMAGTVTLPKTGQTTSYATGDDGALQRGVAWPNPRFTDNTASGHQTVTDNLTGLMWTKDANLPGTYKTWQQAMDYVASMNSGAGTYGYTDWRLPNRKELFSLVDRAMYNPSLPSGHPFINVQSYHYWSSTSYASATSVAWIVDMGGGYVSAYAKSLSYYVWPVRSGHVDPLVNLAISKTGTGSGTVTSADGSINCGSTCSALFSQGASVTLTANSDNSTLWTFAGWSGDCTGTSSTCTLTMSAAKNVTATFNQSCTYTIVPTSKNFPSSGGSYSVDVYPNVATNAGYCTWTASSNASWITINSGSTGSGNGTVAYTVAANADTSQRTGTLIIAGQTFTVTQSGIDCSSKTLTPTSKNFTSSGGSDSVGITANTGCSWTASSNASWITINSGSTGSGNGSVSYTVSANTSTSPLTGTMTIAGKTFTVTQDGAPCTYSITPTTKNFTSTGGSDSVGVTANTGCTWTASSNASWITINSGSTGSGNGTVNYTVATNTSTSPLTGTMTIAGKTFTVTQDAQSGCTYTILPTSASVASAGGGSTVAITTNTGCTWTATSNNPTWITVSPSNGTGSGSVTYTATANTSTNSRTGTLIIAGQTFTVSQEGTCGYTINPTTKSFTAAGGNDIVGVTASKSLCQWTATTNADWITITSGSAGTSSGTVAYTVAANTTTTSPRTGTLTIAGLTFTVTQDPPCTYSIAPTSKSFTASAGGDSAIVTTASGCPWSASSNNPDWITITSGSSGTGNGTVVYKVTANTGLNLRMGTLTIAGKTLTVSQDPPNIATLTVIKQGSGDGTVTDSLGKLAFTGNTGIASYNTGTDVILTASPSIGSTLKAWTGCDSTTGSQCILKMTAPRTVTVEFSIPITPIYDFNGDGKSDVLWRNTTTGDVYIWLMNKTSITGGDFVVKGLTADWDIKGVGDFNGDGKADIVWQNTNNGDVYIYLMDGTKILINGYALRGIPKEWDFKKLGDFDGDGKTDILWQNTTTGDVAIWGSTT
ncbi:MAG: DUF1566 domain-containing protein, partial [Nitrospirae bacterium]|nr:DUF1566 domain-containing protein [Nitrospirota bacterium]